MFEARIRKGLEPEHITAIIDTREQEPLELAPLKTMRGTLDTADYSVLGLQHIIGVERKSLNDLIGSLSQERERFEREMQRLLAYPVRALVIEADWSTIELKQYRSRMHPNAVMGSLMGLIAQTIPVVMIGNHQRAGVWVSRMLYLAAKREWAKAYPFLATMADVV